VRPAELGRPWPTVHESSPDLSVGSDRMPVAGRRVGTYWMVIRRDSDRSG